MAHNRISTFEPLESRTMMSVVGTPHVEAAAKAPAVKTPVHQVMPLVKTIDPTTTEKDITYSNFSSDPLFASTGPTMTDINQGYLGDCYLLSTLSSVVKTDPALIKKDIVQDGTNLYTVTLGKSKQIEVNADLPVWADGQIAYAGLGVQNSLWVALMEKAYVIYASPKAPNYNAINGGWMSSAFSALGLTSQTIQTASSGSSLAGTLRADLKAGDFTTFGTLSTLPAGSPLIAGHAYEVNAVNDDADGNPVSVTLRNPWGDGSADDGIITVTAPQLFNAFAGVVISHT